MRSYFPSAYEAFPISLLEAASSGLALLVTRVSGADELVAEGRNGWFIERDAEVIAGRLRQLSADRRMLREDGGGPHGEATRELSWEKAVGAYADLYGDLAGSGVGRMRLVVVSHPCITPVNQDFYARVQAHTGWDVTILLPKRWKTEYGRLQVERWPAFRGGLIPLPVALRGDIPLHAYVARLRSRLKAVRPDVLYIHNEPYAVSTFQFSRAAHGLNVPFGFYSAQNLNKRYPWPVRRLERWVYAHADFAFPVSTAVADVLREKGFPKPGRDTALARRRGTPASGN